MREKVGAAEGSAAEGRRRRSAEGLGRRCRQKVSAEGLGNTLAMQQPARGERSAREARERRCREQRATAAREQRTSAARAQRATAANPSPRPSLVLRAPFEGNAALDQRALLFRLLVRRRRVDRTRILSWNESCNVMSYVICHMSYVMCNAWIAPDFYRARAVGQRSSGQTRWRENSLTPSRNEPTIDSIKPRAVCYVVSPLHAGRSRADPDLIRTSF